MKSIGPFGQDMEPQIDLGGGGEMERVSAHDVAGLPRKTSPVKQDTMGVFLKMLRQPAKVLVKQRAILVALEKIRHFPLELW